MERAGNGLFKILFISNRIRKERMKIAIITGASSGLGREFFLQAGDYFSDIEEFWLVARRAERLAEYAALLPDKKVVCVPLDLAKDESYSTLSELLAERKPEVRLFVNNAGLGFWGSVESLGTEKQINCVDVNVKAVTALSAAILPYMGQNGRIIFTSSIASFAPNAYMTTYSSSKAYVTAFARGLRYELKKDSRKIKVTVVCPGPMATEFISVGGVKSKTFEQLPYCDPVKVVRGTLKCAKRGKFIYTNRLFFKFYRLVAKILPAAWVMPMAKT